MFSQPPTRGLPNRERAPEREVYFTEREVYFTEREVYLTKCTITPVVAW